MKAKEDKFLLVLSSPEDVTTIQVETSTIKCLKIKKLLNINTVYKLEFDTLVHICYNWTYKLLIYDLRLFVKKLPKNSKHIQE